MQNELKKFTIVILKLVLSRGDTSVSMISDSNLLQVTFKGATINDGPCIATHTIKNTRNLCATVVAAIYLT